MPFGKSVGSGGGATLWTISEFARAFQFSPTMTMRHGVAIGPWITAGFLRRSMSLAYTLNSRNPISTNKPDFSSRMFTANLGGPLGKRASYFFDFNRRQITDNALVDA